jgi:hypothetical protein
VKDISVILTEQLHWKKSDIYKLALDEQVKLTSEEQA